MLDEDSQKILHPQHGLSLEFKTPKIIEHLGLHVDPDVRMVCSAGILVSDLVCLNPLMCSNDTGMIYIYRYII